MNLTILAVTAMLDIIVLKKKIKRYNDKKKNIILHINRYQTSGFSSHITILL